MKSDNIIVTKIIYIFYTETTSEKKNTTTQHFQS